MKKLRRVLAVLLVFVMSMALVTGCSGKSKQTMFSIMKDASSMTHYSYDVKVKVDSGISGVENMTIALKGQTDGEALTMGAEVSYSLYTFNIDNFLTLTKDAVYIDVEEIFNAFDSILSAMGVSLADFEEEFGSELKCIKLPLAEGMINVNADSSELTDLYVSILETAFRDTKIESNKGEYTVTVEGMEDIAKLVDALLTEILNNQDALLTQLEKLNSIDDDTMKEFLNSYMEELIEALVKFNEEYELGFTDDDIADVKAEAESAVEDAVKEAELDDVNQIYKDGFAQIKDNKQDIVDELAGGADSVDGKVTMTNSLTGREGSRVYTCEFETSLENKDTQEDLTLTVKSVITEDNSIVVNAPKNYTALSDIMYAALVYAYENGLLGDLDGIIDMPDVDPDYSYGGDASNAGEDASNAGEDVVYDGEVTLSDPSTNDTATIEYNKDLVYVDTEYSDVELGDVYFRAVADDNCSLTLYYWPEFSIDAWYEYMVHVAYSDSESFPDLSSTELTSRELSSGVTLYEFDVSYKYPYEDSRTTVSFFAVAANGGFIYGYVLRDYSLQDDSVLPYDEFLNAVFVNVN